MDLRNTWQLAEHSVWQFGNSTYRRLGVCHTSSCLYTSFLTHVCELHNYSAGFCELSSPNAAHMFIQKTQALKSAAAKFSVSAGEGNRIIPSKTKDAADFQLRIDAGLRCIDKAPQCRVTG